MLRNYYVSCATWLRHHLYQYVLWYIYHLTAHLYHSLHIHNNPNSKNLRNGYYVAATNVQTNHIYQCFSHTIISEDMHYYRIYQRHTTFKTMIRIKTVINITTLFSHWLFIYSYSITVYNSQSPHTTTHTGCQKWPAPPHIWCCIWIVCKQMVRRNCTLELKLQIPWDWKLNYLTITKYTCLHIWLIGTVSLYETCWWLFQF